MIPLTGYRTRGPRRGLRTAHPGVIVIVLGAGLLLVGLIAIPLMVVGGTNMMFAAGGCPSGQGGTATTSPQGPAPAPAANSIPADYLHWFRAAGAHYNVPWPVLAGIGKVESDDGQSNAPGVHSGNNGFGAAGPMQIGIGGAAGNTWAAVKNDFDGDGVASVYAPGDAIAGAAIYLVAHGVQQNVQAAIFAYNHLLSYVQAVMGWANQYAKGGFTTIGAPNPATTATTATASGCTGNTATTTAFGTVPNSVVAKVIAYARAQLGKPYQWGGTGPDSFDCSGLVMMAYRAAGVNIPRTSEEQWAWGPRIQPGHEEPGDLVFFAGSDGTMTNPGHVGLVIGKGTFIEAYATGFPIRISHYAGPDFNPGNYSGGVVGFTRPWAHSGVVLRG